MGSSERCSNDHASHYVVLRAAERQCLSTRIWLLGDGSRHGLHLLRYGSSVRLPGRADLLVESIRRLSRDQSDYAYFTDAAAQPRPVQLLLRVLRYFTASEESG